MVIYTVPSAKKQKIVTHSDLNKLSRQLNLSDTKAKENAKAIRTLFGRNVIEKGYNKSLPEKSKVMEYTWLKNTSWNLFIKGPKKKELTIQN